MNYAWRPHSSMLSASQGWLDDLVFVTLRRVRRSEGGPTARNSKAQGAALGSMLPQRSFKAQRAATQSRHGPLGLDSAFLTTRPRPSAWAIESKAFSLDLVGVGRTSFNSPCPSYAATLVLLGPVSNQ